MMRGALQILVCFALVALAAATVPADPNPLPWEPCWDMVNLVPKVMTLLNLAKNAKISQACWTSITQQWDSAWTTINAQLKVHSPVESGVCNQWNYDSCTFDFKPSAEVLLNATADAQKHNAQIISFDMPIGLNVSAYFMISPNLSDVWLNFSYGVNLVNMYSVLPNTCGNEVQQLVADIGTLVSLGQQELNDSLTCFNDNWLPRVTHIKLYGAFELGLSVYSQFDLGKYPYYNLPAQAYGAYNPDWKTVQLAYTTCNLNQIWDIYTLINMAKQTQMSPACWQALAAAKYNWAIVDAKLAYSPKIKSGICTPDTPTTWNFINCTYTYNVSTAAYANSVAPAGFAAMDFYTWVKLVIDNVPGVDGNFLSLFYQVNVNNLQFVLPQECTGEVSKVMDDFNKLVIMGQNEVLAMDQCLQDVFKSIYPIQNMNVNFTFGMGMNLYTKVNLTTALPLPASKLSAQAMLGHSSGAFETAAVMPSLLIAVSALAMLLARL